MKNFLLEIFSEEIPAGMQEKAEEQLSKWLDKEISLPLCCDGKKVFSGPRRLSFILENVSLKEETSLEKQGPLVSAGEQAFQGFCRSCKVQPDQCYVKETPKGSVWAVLIEPAKESIESRLVNLCETLLKTFFWPKRMRWTLSSQTWVRPIRGLIALYGEKPLIWTFEDVAADNWTRGHRLIPIEKVLIDSPEQYEQSLKQAFVVLSRQKRIQRIQKDVKELASSVQCTPCESVMDELVHENAGLAEWPSGFLGSFNPSFLRLPQEVITTSLRVHQKCFPLVKQDSQQLAPYFIAISDVLSPGPLVKKGYEKVITARLTDALFFWDQDVKHPLSFYAEHLHQRTFFDGLGSLYQKMQRIKNAGSVWLSMIGKESLKESFSRVAEVMKADLATSMVGEFPSLQGIMGYYYANEQGWPQDQAVALKEQYTFGRGNGEICEKDLPLGGALAITEAMDSLVGFFALGHQPSGSKDPMALKRSASIVIKGCLGYGVHFHLSSALQIFLDQYKAQGFLKDVNDLQSLRDFFQDRLAYILSEIGISEVFIRACLAPGVGYQEEHSLWQMACKAKKLYDLSSYPQGESFFSAYKRLNSLLNDLREDDHQWVPEKLSHETECALKTLLDYSLPKDIPQLLDILEQWGTCLNAFFDALKVSDPQYKAFRLGLLHKIEQHFSSWGHLNAIV